MYKDLLTNKKDTKSTIYSNSNSCTNSQYTYIILIVQLIVFIVVVSTEETICSFCDIL